MRGAWIAVALLLPAVAAAPVAHESEYQRYVGVATQGSYDHGYDWLDAWHGAGNWECLQSTTNDVYVLRVLDGADGDVLMLETRPGVRDALAQAPATRASPAALEGYSSSLCLEFAVLGASVATAARYEVLVCDVGVGGLPAYSPCGDELPRLR